MAVQQSEQCVGHPLAAMQEEWIGGIAGAAMELAESAAQCNDYRLAASAYMVATSAHMALVMYATNDPFQTLVRIAEAKRIAHLSTDMMIKAQEAQVATAKTAQAETIPADFLSGLTEAIAADDGAPPQVVDDNQGQAVDPGEDDDNDDYESELEAEADEDEEDENNEIDETNDEE